MDEPRTVAFIDVGTNSVHVIVVSFVPGTSGVVVAREREVIRLGRSLYSGGVIDDDAIRRCRLVIERFAAYARKHGADEIHAFATCASREASNGPELIESLSVPGVQLKVIPGEEEARLIRLGVLGERGFNDNVLLVDIGGGSTEFSIVGKDGKLFCASLPIGAVRFAYSFPFDPLAKVSEEDFKCYQREVDVKAMSVIRRIKEIGFSKVIGSSGSFETLADFCGTRDEGGIPFVPLERISSAAAQFRNMDIGGRRAIPKLNPDRADIIVAGASIAEEILSLLGVEGVFISRGSLKEGMMEDFRISQGYPFIGPRESSVNSLLYRTGSDREHAFTVRDYSLRLFDRLGELGLHTMDASARELLGNAALLHDVGEFIGYPKHHITSYNLILDALSGYTDDELMFTAMIARYHHKKIPQASDPVYRSRGIADVPSLMKCICILRMADAMDRHRAQIVKDFAVDSSEGKVTVIMSSEEDISMEIWKLMGCSKDFLFIFGSELAVVRADSLK